MNTRMKWTTLSQVKSSLEKKWSRGLFLKDLIEPSGLFPLRIPLRGPGSDELSKEFDIAREWVQQYVNLDKKQLFRVEWHQVNHRILGQNEIPVAVLFENRDDCIRFIGKLNQFELFDRSSQELLAVFPDLQPWIVKNPFVLLDYAPVLEKLIRVAGWMIKTPKPGIYLRQLSLENIDTKFIETHKKLLGEWFDILLDQSDIDITSTGVRGFERRYGFLEKPVQVRFRILDESKYINGMSDLAIRADEFCKLNMDIDTVFVTENDINGLTFPMVKNSIVLFGRGYGFDYLREAQWLKHKAIWYWGDIDTHGFAILSQFRSLFPQVSSFLMDRDTLLLYKQYWVKETVQGVAMLENLTEEENALYNDIRLNRLGEFVRLEQEFIPFDYLEGYLVRMGKMRE